MSPTSPRLRRIAGVFLLSLSAVVAANYVTAEAKSSVALDQCANLGTVCDSSHPSQWQHGNLNQSNSNYPEGSTVPYRAILQDLTAGGTYAVTIEWDTSQQGHHAIDYLTSLGRTVATADPCAGTTCTAPTNTLAIPADPNVSAAGVTQPAGQVFRVDGASFVSAGGSVANTGNLCAGTPCAVPVNPSAYLLTGDYTGSSTTSVTVWITASGPDVVLSWGGHVAAQADWGAGNSASNIEGSPYHMRILHFLCSDDSSCSAGNEDRSMSNTAVVPVTTTTTIPDLTTTTTIPDVTTTTTIPDVTTTTIPDVTTTTTIPDVTTTTTIPDVTTTTTIPDVTTTTTIPASTTTTVPGSTTSVAQSTTTAVAASTTTTTVPTDFSVIFPATTTTEPDDYAVTYPSSLPSTGSSVTLNIIGALLVLLGLVVLPLMRRHTR